MDSSFFFAQLLGPGDLRKPVCLGPKTLHYAKFWAQNATKTSAGNSPESLSNLFLRDNCRLLQRLLNDANMIRLSPPLRIPNPLVQCHAEGGATKAKTQANASKRRQTQRRKRKGENASKREQTWTNANKRLRPPSLRFFYTPLGNPLTLVCALSDRDPNTAFPKATVERFAEELGVSLQEDASSAKRDTRSSLPSREGARSFTIPMHLLSAGT